MKKCCKQRFIVFVCSFFICYSNIFSEKYSCKKTFVKKFDGMSINSIAWSPHENNLIAVSYGGQNVEIWNIESGLSVAIFKHHEYVNRVEWNPNNNNELATLSGKSSFTIWNTKTGIPYFQKSFEKKLAYSLSWNGGAWGEIALSLSSGGVFILNSIDRGIIKNLCEDHAVLSVLWNKHCPNILFFYIFSSGEIKVWDTQKSEFISILNVPNGNNIVFEKQLSCDPFLAQIAVALNKNIVIFDYKTGSVVKRFGFEHKVNAIAFNPFVEHEIAVAVGKKVLIFDTKDEKIVGVVKHDAFVDIVTWSLPSSCSPYRLATTEANQITIWELKIKKEI